MTTTDERERTVAMVHRCAQHQDVDPTFVLMPGTANAPASAPTGMSPSDAGIDGHACVRWITGNPAQWCSLVAGHEGACVSSVQA